MSRTEVLLVAGTHGNEKNAPWLLDHCRHQLELQKRNSLNVSTVIGNPLAYKKGLRYIDRDLNRSFSEKLLSSFPPSEAYEIKRAKELIDLYGPKSKQSCKVVIDFHSTTSVMGSCLVVYGRRPADLALGGLIQARLGLPIYLHEGDASETGFLVEQWPCGLVVEIGPVPQGLLNSKIIHQTLIALQTCLNEIHKVKLGEANFPQRIVIHRHLKSVDFPRDLSGNINAYLHPQIEGRDWIPISKGQPLFTSANGDLIRLNFDDLPESVIPVFINEAAYLEKGIAMSFTTKENWLFDDSWSKTLGELLV